MFYRIFYRIFFVYPTLKLYPPRIRFIIIIFFDWILIFRYNHVYILTSSTLTTLILFIWTIWSMSQFIPLFPFSDGFL